MDAKSSPHLLVSVFLTPHGLNSQTYKLGKIATKSEFFRIERYLSALSSLREIEWRSVQIYLGLDPVWEHLFEELSVASYSIFPNSTVEFGNLRNRTSWSVTAEKFESDSLIYLHSNDDHMLMPGGARELMRIAAGMANSDVNLAHVTHFPELRARLASSKVHGPGESTGIALRMPIGTMLVKSDFFKSWWIPNGQFTDDQVIVRPDNPFGPSVAFEPELALVPSAEIFRHMDGYAHVFLSRPLAAVPNTAVFRPGGHPNVELGELRAGLWPCPLTPFSRQKFAVDVHLTSEHSRSFQPSLRKIRLGVARYQAAWGLRFDPVAYHEIKGAAQPLDALSAALGAFISLFTWPVARNFPDVLLDPIGAWALQRVHQVSPRSWFIKNMIEDIGTCRTILKYGSLIVKRWLR